MPVQKIFLILILVSTFISAVTSQNCDIVVDGQSSTVPPEETTSWPELPSTPFSSNSKQFNEEQEPSSRNGRGEFTVNIPDNWPTDTPFKVGRNINVAFAVLKNPYFKIVLGEDDLAEFYVTTAFKDYVDTMRDYPFLYPYPSIHLRCTDGTTNVFQFYVDVQDENTKPPVFTISLLSLSVAQPWPIEIPINSNTPFFIRDEDFSLQNARVTTSIDVDILTVRLLPLFPQSGSTHTEPYDYKVELLLKPGVGKGDYLIKLDATDGVNNAVSSYIRLNVTEAACRGEPKEPVFGLRGSEKGLTYYNATLTTIPRVGDILPGVLIQAYDPDELCSVKLNINSDYLNINAQGEIVFVKSLTADKLVEAGRTWITEVEAIGEKSGKTQNVPLIITVNI